MTNHSMTDVAFEIMTKKKKAIPFKNLWEQIVTEMGYSESVAFNKVSQFYANLSLDNRFTMVEDGKWDLRSRHTYNETHKDLSEILDDTDDILEDEFDDEENYDDEASEDTKESYSSDEDEY